MGKILEFKSEKFPPYEGEEEDINPGLWRKRLAEYLQNRLPSLGVPVVCIGSEDWGWMVEIDNKDFPLWIGCGHQYGPADQFVCFVEPSKPVIRKWFRKIDTTAQVHRVTEALLKILESDNDIYDIKWISD